MKTLAVVRSAVKTIGLLRRRAGSAKMPALVSPPSATRPGRVAFQGHSAAGHKQRRARRSEEPMPRPYTPEERRVAFWNRVDIREAGECWPWRGHTVQGGYGQFSASVGAKGTSAHRVAFIFTYGDPGEYHVLHSCDNPPCCNPEHLWIGTNTDNVADKVAKGRQARLGGMLSPTSKLTDDAVRDIRARRAGGEGRQSIAADYRIDVTNVSCICLRKTWKNVI